jgi:UDP-N-acetylglucosamine/UDP-N-acetylgalactosamine diphosphorylase
MESLISKFEAAGQGHVFANFSELSPESQQSLLKEASEIDLELVSSLYNIYVSGKTEEISTNFSPFPNIFDLASATPSHYSLLQRDGLELITKGKSAVLTFAGGQGTRLGVSYPKGMYDISLISHKSLFQIFAERLIKLRNLGGVHTPAIPWLIMVNGETLDLITEFFNENSYFGLERSQVFFFKQEMLPALTFDGKIIMTDINKISMSPNGNGGVYEGLLKSKGLDWLEEKGIKYLNICGIDNVLLKVSDPIFLGFAENHDADISTKVIAKNSYSESMGVLGLREGKKSIIEYSEMSEEMAKMVDDNGKLVYFSGNILNHIFKVSFLRQIASSLDILRSKYHIAKKKVPYWENGVKTTPTQPNGVKFELFYFDLFPLAANSAAIEVVRSEEFAPVKNAKGQDSPESARNLVSNLHLQWIRKAGAIVQGYIPEGCVCEISPLISYGGENLEFLQDKKISLPFYLYY